MNIHLGCKPLGYCRPIRRERLRQSLLSPCLRVFLPQRLADAFMALRTASFWAGLTFRRLRLRARMVLVWRSWAKTSEIFFFPRPPSAPTAFLPFPCLLFEQLALLSEFGVRGQLLGQDHGLLAGELATGPFVQVAGAASLQTLHPH